MACYRPLIRFELVGEYETAKDGHRYNKFKIISSNRIEEELKSSFIGKYKNFELIPCGKCVGCRLDYSREWADRAYLEMKTTGQENCYFLTLTYNEENLPTVEEITTSKGITYTEDDAHGNNISWKGTLRKKDLQKFINTLRKIMERDYDQHEGIRYMASGEYGEKDGRPHYHLILFNIELPAESFYNTHFKDGMAYYKNKIIERAWNKGIINITEATWNTSAYVGRYICKKLYGDMAEDERAALGRAEKEFMLVSNRPPIGRRYYDEHKKEIYKNDKILIKKRDKIEYHAPPRYYDFLYEKEFPEDFKKIKERRQKNAKNSEALKSLKTSLNQWDRLQVELSSKINKDKSLIRPL